MTSQNKFPGPLLLPPQCQNFDTYEELVAHFEQSSELLLAFKENWSLATTLYSDVRNEFEGERWGYRHYIKKHARNYRKPDPNLLQSLENLIADGEANEFGCVVLVKMFVEFHLYCDRTPEYDEYEDVDLIALFIKRLSHLKPVNPDPSSVFRGFDSQKTLFQTSAKEGFNETYIDPHGGVAAIQTTIRGMMKKYRTKPHKYCAPLTSVVSSSMTGKSRLLKEIALTIPTIYICVRDPALELETSYPPSFSDHLVEYLLQSDDTKSSPPHDPPFVKCVRRFKIFIYSLVEVVRSIQSRVQDAASPREVREFLWYLFAEPKSIRFAELCKVVRIQDDAESTLLWFNESLDNVVGALDKFYTSTSNEWETYDRDGTIDGAFLDLWGGSLEHLAQIGETSRDDAMMLFVWDEARSVVSTSVRGEKMNWVNVDISKFMALRRALNQISQIKNKKNPTDPRINLFHLFTDTTSRLEDFRAVETITEQGVLFAPIVNIPTYDYHANTKLDITIDPDVVSNSRRLLHFGRSAWLSMSSRLEDSEILAIASKKLTKLTRSGLDRLLKSDRVKCDADHAVMMALMGCRLGLQTGAAVKLTHDLVASHMMTILHVPPNGSTITAHYPSEPILAAVSAETTSSLGWMRPLESLIAAVSAGIVDKGYRGELDTKIVLLMAMEDSLVRAPYDETSNTFKQSRPVSVDEFLFSLLYLPQTTLANATSPRNSTSSGIAASILGGCQPAANKETTKRGMIPDPTAAREEEEERSDVWDSDEEEGSVFDDGEDDEGDSDEHEPSEEVGHHSDRGRSTFDVVPEIVGEWARHRTITRAGSNNKLARKRKAALNEVLKLKDGLVNFNHFIPTEAVMSTSLLLEGWNRGAGYQTQPNTHGVDFIIPVLLRSKKNLDLGPLFGPWTVAQEAAASSVLSYILIDSKNWLSMTDAELKYTVEKCRPSTRNFASHTPVNPYISIVQCVGCEPVGRTGVTIYPSLDTGTPNDGQIQLKIAAVGISPSTYTCLRQRPACVPLLQRLRRKTSSPISSYKPEGDSAISRIVEDALPCQLPPRRQFNMRNLDSTTPAASAAGSASDKPLPIVDPTAGAPQVAGKVDPPTGPAGGRKGRKGKGPQK